MQELGFAEIPVEPKRLPGPFFSDPCQIFDRILASTSWVGIEKGLLLSTKRCSAPQEPGPNRPT
jgi:hypothetical protein